MRRCVVLGVPDPVVRVGYGAPYAYFHVLRGGNYRRPDRIQRCDFRNAAMDPGEGKSQGLRIVRGRKG